MSQIGSRSYGRQLVPHQAPIADTEVFTIGDLSREFDVSLRALRFYEDRDLLHPHRRGNARYYSSQQRVRLQIILKGKQLGFTLTEIHDMLAAKPDKEPTELDLGLTPEQILAQIDHLERQRLELDQAIGELRASHRQFAAHETSVAA